MTHPISQKTWILKWNFIIETLQFIFGYSLGGGTYFINLNAVQKLNHIKKYKLVV